MSFSLGFHGGVPQRKPVVSRTPSPQKSNSRAPNYQSGTMIITPRTRSDNDSRSATRNGTTTYSASQSSQDSRRRPLPVDIQEKMDRWREKRLRRQEQEIGGTDFEVMDQMDRQTTRKIARKIARPVDPEVEPLQNTYPPTQNPNSFMAGHDQPDDEVPMFSKQFTTPYNGSQQSYATELYPSQKHSTLPRSVVRNVNIQRAEEQTKERNDKKIAYYPDNAQTSLQDRYARLRKRTEERTARKEFSQELREKLFNEDVSRQPVSTRMPPQNTDSLQAVPLTASSLATDQNQSQDQNQTQTQNLPPTDTSGSFFHPTNQEILKGIVANEVKVVLDQLKKERPELANQADVMNIVTQRTRKFEDSLQQFNVQVQRLRDTVDKNEISLKAVQTNIDTFKQGDGDAVLTEETMRSFVSHFYNDQIGHVKKEIQKDTQKLKETVTHLENNERKQRERLDDVTQSFQETLQKMYEDTCNIRGEVLEDVKVYETIHEKSDEKSNSSKLPKPLRNYKSGEKVLLVGSAKPRGKDRWMKTRWVDCDTAQLHEGWVPVFINGKVNIGKFSLVV